MALRAILIFATLLALTRASPTRRHYAGITEESVSNAPATSGGTDWDDNEDFDTDGDDWFSKAAVSPSSVPSKARQDVGDYDDDYSRGNVMVEFGEDDDDDDEEEGDEDEHLQDAEEDDGSRNDSEFLFLPPRDSRLMLEDDDDDQSGPIKVRHTGRSNYQHESDDNSLESMEDDKDAEEQHPYEFTIDQDDKGSDEDDDDEDDEHRADDTSVDTSLRHETRDNDNDDEDEFVSEDGQDDMFDNPAEESAQVIYGDHVLLY